MPSTLTKHSHADYNTTENSWLEQRTFVTYAPYLLSDKELAGEMLAELHDLENPTPPSTTDMTPVADPVGKSLSCGPFRLAFDSSGALSDLTHLTSGVRLANESHTLGSFIYKTYNDTDYREFLSDFAIRINPPGQGCLNASDPMTCFNFRKPNMTAAAHPLRRHILPHLTALYSRSNSDSCSFVTQVSTLLRMLCVCVLVPRRFDAPHHVSAFCILPF
jgi:hypothetical protein